MIYFVVFLFALFLFGHNINSVKKEDDRIGYISLLFILIALCTFRYRVGGDTLHYFDVFENYFSFGKDFNVIDSEYNIGWNLLNFIIKSIYDSFYFFQFVHAIIINCVIFYIIKKYSINKFLVILFYLIFYFLYFNMEILRESLAVAFFLLAIPYLIAKKWIPYYLLCLLALSFHSSAAILFIMPLFAVNVKLKYQIFILVVVTFLVNVLSVENVALNLFSESQAVQRAVRSYFSLETNLIGMIVQLLKIIPVYFILKVAVKKNISHPLVIFVTPYLIIGVLSAFIPGVYRFLNYIAIPILIFNVDILFKLFRQRKTYFLSYIQVLASITFLVLVQLQYYLRDMSEYSYTKNSIFFNRYEPYHSILDEKSDKVREDIFYNSIIENQ
jgi:hypothetical protein